MGMTIKQRVATGALVLALLGGTGASVAAQNQGSNSSGNQGVAAGLIATIVQLNNSGSFEVITVDVDDTLNNLRALNNILNNSPILNNLSIEVEDVNVLSGFTVFLLSNGDSIIFQ